MSEIKSIDGLYHALGDSGLLTDYRSDRTKVILYLQALIDEAQVYMDTYPKVEEGTLSERAVLSLAQIRDLRDTDPEFQLQMGTVGPHANVPDEKPLFQALFRDGPSHQ